MIWIFIFPPTCLKFNMLLPFKLLHCHGWELWDELPVHYLALSDKTGRNLPRYKDTCTLTIWLQVEFVLSQRFKITFQKRSLLIRLEQSAQYSQLDLHKASTSIQNHRISWSVRFKRNLLSLSSGANAAGSGLVRGQVQEHAGSCSNDERTAAHLTANSDAMWCNTWRPGFYVAKIIILFVLCSLSAVHNFKSLKLAPSKKLCAPCGSPLSQLCQPAGWSSKATSSFTHWSSHRVLSYMVPLRKEFLCSTSLGFCTSAFSSKTISEHIQTMLLWTASIIFNPCLDLDIHGILQLSHVNHSACETRMDD